MRRLWIGVVVCLGLAALAWQVSRSPAATAPAAEESVESFLARHWNHPLAPQGQPPASWSSLEASLDGRACGQCHVAQWEAWRTSLHSQAMGPGIQWQLRLMDQAQANRCLRCHAPLAEQKALIALERGFEAAPQGPRPDFVPADLHRQGVSCPVCHVRNHTRHGPPPRPESRLAGEAHGGFQVQPAFEDSRFCATCHQFPEDGPRLAGKLHEDTYAQWQTSPYAGEQSCQQCHMPDRQHRFRGIHDPDTVRQAIAVELTAERTRDGGLARVAVHNRGAGHHFPTYMVPKVYVQLALVAPDGTRQPLGTEVIGWQVDVGITRELFDTRIPAKGQHTFTRPFTWPQETGWRLEASVEVAPREHYERIFADTLQRAGQQLDADTNALLRAALAEAVATRFHALRVSRELGTDPTSASQP